MVMLVHNTILEYHNHPNSKDKFGNFVKCKENLLFQKLWKFNKEVAILIYNQALFILKQVHYELYGHVMIKKRDENGEYSL